MSVSATGLLQRAETLADHQPDLARAMVVEAIGLAIGAGADELYARACEVMGRVAAVTGDFALAAEPLAAALAAYEAAGDRSGMARASAGLAFCREPRPYADEAEALAAELELVWGLLDPPAEPDRWAGLGVWLGRAAGCRWGRPG